MKLILKIDSTDNAAFEGERVWEELADIVSWAAEKIRFGQASGRCLDSNGNAVGSWSTSGEPNQ